MSGFIEYTTTQGDRLDLIAHKVYGNSHNWGPILEANPGFAIDEVYQAGITIAVPVKDSQDIGLNNDQNLPPWKK